MKASEIGVAFSAEKADFSQNLGFVPILAETTIVILDIMCCEDHSVGDFNKISVIAASRTSEPHTHIGADTPTCFGFYRVV